MLDFLDVQTKLKMVLDDKRYVHSEAVSQTAVQLAKRFGCPEEKALYAGMLHDCAKGYKHKEALELCKKYMLNVKDLPKGVIHSFLGAELAKTEYFINDSDILTAIRYHATGRPNMSLLEKIILVSDMIEPNRQYEEVTALRELATEDINKALAESLKLKIQFVTDAGKQVDRLSLIALDSYRNFLYMS